MVERRTKRFLLRATALSVGGLLVGCGSRKDAEPTSAPPPGNPKGSIYDDAATAATPPDAATPDAEVAVPDAAPPPDAAPDAATKKKPIRDPRPIPPPGNPKGSLYDDGAFDKKAPRKD